MNKNLTKAKEAKNDEFYTQLEDIEREINAYLDFDATLFNGKTVLLPCDDPEWSNFTKYFIMNFSRLGLKKLISTSFAISKKQGVGDLHPTPYEKSSPQFDPEKAFEKGKIFTLSADKNTGRCLDIADLEWSYLNGDGDFRSEEISRLRDEADIVITNPPFSLFRDFLGWLTSANCRFLMIGNLNAISYKEVFPLIKSNKMWLGNGFQAGNAYFRTPTTREYAAGVVDVETGLVKFRNCCWYTNLDHGRRHRPLDLMSMSDNKKFNKSLIGKSAYERYDNYDAIEVPFTDAIPDDYEGPMAVPISFLNKYCPDQFEILSANDIIVDEKAPRKPHGLIKDKDGTIDGTPKYVRLVIKRSGIKAPDTLETSR